MAEKEDKFLKMRKEIMTFAERERKNNMSTMDFVDCIIVNWFIPYKEQARKEALKLQLKEIDAEYHTLYFVEGIIPKVSYYKLKAILERKHKELLERKEGVDRSEM